MYKAEVHETIQQVQLLEKLDLDLDITERAYRSEHELEGELRVVTEPNEGVVRAREAPVRTLLSPVVRRIRDEGDRTPPGLGVRAFVGLSRDVPLSVDEEAYQEGHLVDTVDVDGLPENGTVEVDADWDRSEAERMLAEGEVRVISEPYDVDGLPGDQLPIIIRAELYRDATVLAERVDGGGDRGPGGGPRNLEGQAALVLHIEHRDTADSGRPLWIDRLDLEFSQTFPQIWFQPDESATYDPESRQVEWSNRRVTAGDDKEFAVIGPIRELLDIDTITANFRAKLPGESLTGMQVENGFDESGQSFLRADDEAIQHTVRVTGSAEIDPSALRGEVQESTSATIRVRTTPKDLYQRVRKICDANGIHIRESDDVGEAEPVTGKDGVFEITEDPGGEGVGAAGWLKISKEYGDRGVVHADITVTGQFTAISEQREVSVEEGGDSIVRADEGSLDSRGDSKIELKVRSASTELNSELVSTFERELERGS